MGKKINLEVDFFKVLGVKASSSDEEVKKAYKALAKQWHPDKNNEEGAEEQFKVISAAYDTLKSADERSIYRREREQAQVEAEREQKRKRQKETYGFYEPSSSDSANSRFKTSSFFKTGGDAGSGRSQKNYSSSKSDSWGYHGREESPFNGEYSSFKTKHDNRSEKKNKKNSKPQKPWSQNWNETSDEDDFKPFDNGFKTFSRSNFSSAFNSFVDDLFDFNSFFNGKDPFESFFKKYENIFEPSAEKKAPPKPDFTYHSTFYDDGKRKERKTRAQDTENRPQNGRRKDSPPGFSFDDYPDDDEDTLRFECVCCGKKFSLQEEMVRHEIVCKDVNGKANGTTRMNRIPAFAKAPGDWRTTHENLMQNLRNLRRSSQTRIEEDEDDEREESPPRPDIDYVKCHICGRTFNRPAMERHQLYCQARYQANCGEPDDTNMFYAREHYPRSMPYPSSGGPPPSRPQSASRGSESPRTSRSSTPSKYSSRTCFPDLGSRRTMEDPFLFTSTGLHGHRSSSSRPPPAPRVHEFRFSSKGANNFGLSGSRMGFPEDKHLTRNQCPNCRSVFARNARYCIGCGFKRAG